jgi:hypothetical protein
MSLAIHEGYGLAHLHFDLFGTSLLAFGQADTQHAVFELRMHSLGLGVVGYIKTAFKLGRPRGSK